jgi:hypothetical protein
VDGLGRKVLVAAFDGWNDAGEAASAAIAHLRESGAYEPVFSIDPELYFDYQYTRPQVAIDGDGKRVLTWPEATILKPVKPTRSTQLWLLTGVEPARAWQAFAAEFVDVALREDITGFVALGSMMSDVPHTRPISVFAGSDSEQIRNFLHRWENSYLNLLRMGQGSLLKLVIMAWYFQPASWAHCGYPGPPKIWP